GKRIVGVYLRDGTEADVPKALNDYGHTIVNRNTMSVVDANEGKDNRFEKLGGELREPVHASVT
ncbi:MAG: hypothetical protein OXC26_24645, partial [Albidovulum sp.]|nr:hypothetical protein [Albidovulum sp.]